jgi:hypothetical protein
MTVRLGSNAGFMGTAVADPFPYICHCTGFICASAIGYYLSSPVLEVYKRRASFFLRDSPSLANTVRIIAFISRRLNLKRAEGVIPG